MSRKFLVVLLPRSRNRGGHLGQEGRFVAARRRLRLQAARQQVGRIRFDHQPVRRDALHERQQVLAAPLIADPARDADARVRLQVVVQFVRMSGEAMRDRRREAQSGIRAGW